MTRAAISAFLATAMIYCAGFFPIVATAADTQPATRVEVTLFGGYRTGGSLEQTVGKTSEGVPIKVDAGLEKGSSYGVTLNWEAESDSFFELAYSRQGTTLDAVTPSDINVSMPIDLTVEYLQIGGYFMTGRPGAKLTPYFLMTIGVGRLVPDDPELRSTTNFAAAIGGGVKYAFTPHIAMRFDARVNTMFLGNDNNIMCASSDATLCKVQLQGDVLFQPDFSLGVTYGF